MRARAILGGYTRSLRAWLFLSILVCCTAAQAQVVTRGPYLQMGTDSSVVVRWRTDTGTNSQVRYGPGPGNLPTEVKTTANTTEHVIELTGLQPGTRYYYSVGTTAQELAGNDATTFFETGPTVGTAAPTRIWVLGDSGEVGIAAENVRDAYELFAAGQYTDLWLMLGDNAYPDGTDPEYQAALFDMYPETLRQSVLWPTIGNHDATSSNPNTEIGPYFDMFTLPDNGQAGGAVSGTESYYSFDYANIHFVVLDSSGSDRSVGGPMLAWLSSDLQSTTQEWIIAFWHHPPYSKGGHDSDNATTDLPLVEMRENALPVLEDHGVDLVLSGHSHSYERSYLIDGHYGPSGDFGPANLIDGGDGEVGGDGAYVKPSASNRQGAVYTVAGASSRTTAGPFGHPVMIRGEELLGSVVLDVDGSTLTGRYLDDTGFEFDEFTIVKDPDLAVDFAAGAESAAAPVSIGFTDLSVADAIGWAWDFDDDGNVDSTEQNPTYHYAQPGLYSVRLTVTTAHGVFEKLKTDYIDVFLIPPVAEFFGEPLIGLVPLSVDFTDLSVNIPSQWEWDFDNDGTPDSTQQNPTHLFTEPGTYTVKLTATNTAGSGQITKTDLIVVVPETPGAITGLRIAADDETISWDALPEACSYDVVKGDLLQLRSSGDLTSSQIECVDDTTTVPTTVDSADPAVDEGFYYLVRGVSCDFEAGTFDTSGIGQLETRDPLLQGPGAACACEPVDDPDADGFCSGLDNCPTTFNTDQIDFDGDAFGDACDCDTVNQYCSSDCTDADLDNFCVTSDCDDLSAETYPGAAPNDDESACMKDEDDDDWGDATPPPAVVAGSDCDDTDSGLTPNTVWYLDSDDDGFGEVSVTIVQCAQPPGYVLDSTDCDDTRDDTFPGSAPSDSAVLCMKDADGDDWGDDNPPAGVAPGTDCDDVDADFNPDTSWYADTDGDGFGDVGSSMAQCAQPAGFVLDSTDCDDASATAADAFPGAAPNDSPQACMKDADGDDWGDATPPAGVSSGTDCNDDDPGLSPATTWHADTDGDGFGDAAETLVQCVQPVGYLVDDTDCDDTSATAGETFPGAAPNDGAAFCMKDVDGDDWGDESPPAGVDVGSDCDDASATAADTFPGAAPNDSGVACMKDVDGDDWGDEAPPSGGVAGTDCDDTDPELSPTTPWYADTDGDGFGDPEVTLAQCLQPAGFESDSTDCDDTGPGAEETFPGAAPGDDPLACMKDVDGDDYGDATPPAGVVPGADCDDDDAVLNPNTIWYADTDGDGFGDQGVTVVVCAQPAGHVLDSTDCDDTSPTAASTFPGAAPNDGGACMRDTDGDDWGDDDPPPGVAAGTDCDDDSSTAAETYPGAAPNDGGACMKDSDGDEWGDDSPSGSAVAGTDCDDDAPEIAPDTRWYQDADGDGFGRLTVDLIQCEQPAGYVLDSTDCDDTSPTAADTFPGAAPNDDGFACAKDTDGDDWGDSSPPPGVFPGSDCDDDDAVLNPGTTWHADTDGDGFGDPGVTLVQCAQPAGHVLDDTDCDDVSAAASQTYPGSAPNDGPDCMTDRDDDDWGDDSPLPGVTPGTDCDDARGDTFPGAAPNDGPACMKDEDGDDWGEENPPAGVTPGTDCDDTDVGLSPDTDWYADSDGDGFGSLLVILTQCDQPTGHVLDSTDCDDTSATAADTFPGAASNDSVRCMKDVDGDDYGDSAPPPGVTGGTDCDDTDAVLNPDTVWSADTDGDGFGDSAVTLVQCLQPAGHVLDDTDCDDTSQTAAETYPGAAPNDGAGCLRDVDGDDWGDAAPPAGVSPGTDCDDSAGSGLVIFPGAAPNDSAVACMKDGDGDDWGDDNPPAGVTPGTDCDDASTTLSPDTLWYADSDSDGFGDAGVTQAQCTQPAGFVADSTDCDDTSVNAAATFPGAAPNDSGLVCMKDADGDDWGDESPPAGVVPGTDCNDSSPSLNPTTTWYSDTDSDGFGDLGVTQVQCPQPAGYVLDSTDCDDTSATAASTFPGAAPGDGAACMRDADGDGWGDAAPPAGVAAGTDCDDGSPTAGSTFPGAAPNDAAGCLKDVDGDDWGDDNPPAGVTAGSDCNDADLAISPDTTWFADTDADGFGDVDVNLVQCAQPAGYLLDSTDCDDTSPTAADTFPGAAPNDGTGVCMKDVDGDDYGDETTLAGVTAGTDCNDDDAVLNPATVWSADTDGDTFGDAGVILVQCLQPAGYLLDNTDCDDTSPAAVDTFPGAAPNDGAGCYKDVDGDDWGDDSPLPAVTPGSDCNDSDPILNPTTNWHADTDSDTFGDPGVIVVQCAQPASHVLDSTDCDDVSATASDTFPGAAPNDSAGCLKDVDGDDWGDESPLAGVSSGTDCDDDDSVINPTTSWYADTDGDTFGDPGVVLVQCLQPAGHLLDNTDCDDTSPTAVDTFPGSAPNDGAGCFRDVDGDDWGDGSPPAGVSAGTDCNDLDPILSPATNWHADTDSDGFGDPGAILVQCVQPAGHLLDNTDCDDTSPAAADTFPGAAPNEGAGCYKDVDGDDWGDDSPLPAVTPGADCNDDDPILNPTTSWHADTDNDAFGDPAVIVVQCAQPASHVLDNTDCDDVSVTASDTFPGAAPNDGAGCLKDVDGDDWGDDNPPAGVSSGTDCDDDDSVINPATSWYADTDGDTFGDPGVVLVQCLQPAGHLLDNTDCDDTSPTAVDTFPGAAPNDGASCLKDVDGDDWGDDSPPAGVSSGTDCNDLDPILSPTTNWHADTDSDTFGDPGVIVVQCAQPASHVLDGTDCDDTSTTAASTFPGAAPNDGASCLKDVDGDDWGDDDPPAGVSSGSDCDDDDSVINPTTIWYADTDGDDFGDSAVSIVQCAQPADHVLDDTDCDDVSATASDAFPGAAPNDGAGCLKDVDGDDWGDDNPPAGVASGTDCDDDDSVINPTTNWYADTDSDGFGDPGVSLTQCAQPVGHLLDNTDCDDTSPTAVDTFPGAAPNDGAGCLKDVDGDDWGDDNPPAGVSSGTDCNDADAGLSPTTVWYADTDGDGFGDPGVTLVQCAQPASHLLDNTDCDDTSGTAADTFPGAAPNDGAGCLKDVDGDDWGDDDPPAGVSSGTDCDDDDSVINPTTIWYADTDGDTFGDPGVSLTQCDQPTDHVLDNADCDDVSATASDTFPGAAPNDGAGCLKDVDGDDWGDDNPPAGVASGTDCDDDDSVINPTTNWYADTDGDGFGDPGVSLTQCAQPVDHLLDNTDCDDTSGTAADTFPGAAPNDGASCLKDVDGDDWGDDNPPAGVSSGTDCNDADAGLSPTTVWYADIDSDGFGDPGVTLVQCAQPASYLLDSTDCDDTSPTAASTFPGAAPNDGAGCLKDVDGDDWGDDSPPAGVSSGTDCDDDDSVINPTTIWYADTDGDDFGDSGVSVVQCAQPANHVLDSTDCDDVSATAFDTFPGAAPNDGAGCLKDVDGDDWGDDNPPAGVSSGTDCDDDDSVINPATNWYADTDSDGFGDPGVSLTQCAQPAGHLLDNTDCDDTSPTAVDTFPGAAPNDGAGCLKDVDGDDWGDDNPPAGVSSGTDCNDADAGLSPTTVWYADTDSDGFGDPGVTLVQCAQPASYLLDSTDCDDTSPTAASTFPGAAPNDGAGCLKDVDGDDWGDDSPPAGVSSGTDCDDDDSVINPTTIWYADTDSDGFGDSGVSLTQCAQPTDHVLDNTDCDDTSGTASDTFPGAAPNNGAGCLKDVDGDDWGDDDPPAGVGSGTDCNDGDSGINPDTIWYADTDSDGFGDPGVSLTQCDQPADHLLDSTDCDDTSPTAAQTFPGSARSDGAACMKDVDGDGYGDNDPPAGVTRGTDCNDGDSGLNPNTVWYADTDTDGFGDPGVTLVQCAQPASYLLDNTDCDDTSPTAVDTFPGAAPSDGAGCLKDVDGDDWGDDNPPAGVSSGTDCDDDDSVINPTTIWYADTDGDDFGDSGVSLVQCAQPANHVLDDTDCDDTSGTAADTFPGAAPNDGAGCLKDVDGDDWGDDDPPVGVGSGTDCNDGDSGINPDTIWYADTDSDGFGDPGVSLTQCDQPADHLLDSTDCDDTSATAADTFPGAAPNDSARCFKDVDGDDWGDATPPAGVSSGTDCDDDDSGINPNTTWYADTDEDGFGDPGETLVQCAQPADYLLDDTDCDDTSATAASTFPNAAPNDGASCLKDADGDDWGDDNPPAGVSSGTDCDDDDSGINPNTTWYADTDEDGFGDPGETLVQCAQPADYLLDNTDCDDTSATAASTFPNAAPNDSAGCLKDADGDDWGDDNPPAGVSSGTDCDDDDSGINPDTTWYADTDGDGFGDSGVTLSQCTQPAAYVSDNTDCDDTSATAASTFPNAAPNDSAGCLKDADGDDWGDDNPPGGVTAGTDCDDSGSTAANIFPGAAPNDSTTSCMEDVDGDDYGDDTPPAGVTVGTDCDDGNATVFPGAGC